MIIMLLLIWIAYFTRSFIFTYCPTTSKTCGGADYYNNPGDALANGAQLNEILFLNEKNELLYKRVPRTTDCTPGTGQTVDMVFPQYCAFSGPSGVSGTWKETAFNSNIYKPVDGTVGPTITTTKDCQPAPGLVVDKGTPLLRWDANPPSD
ncbi:Hypothetical protein HVR_LOCUS34 [uncultured virus]|nr:Hypothetical protein HVR_LOCUS34 [uncultured virus]